MNKNLQRREAMKVLAAAGGLLLLRGVSYGENAPAFGKLGSNWLYQGRPCLIYEQGSILLLINEVGAVGTGVWTGKNTFVVLAGNGWEPGLTAQISNRGKTINWSNNTVWIQGRAARRVQNLSGGWFYSGQPAAIFQEGSTLILINEVGAVGTGIWTVGNMFVILGGAGWGTGLIGQASNDGNTINWSNNTVWTRG